MRYTVAKLHRELAKMIEQGHGRRIVCINKRTFVHPQEHNGAVVLEVAGLGIQWTSKCDEDGGQLFRKDGSEAGLKLCVLVGDAGANMKGKLEESQS